MSILGRHYEVEIHPSRVSLKEEGRELLKTASPAIFRHFLYTAREISFEVKSLKKNTIKLNLGTRKKGQILINGKEAGQFNGRQVEVRVPEGEQVVVIIVQD